MVQVKTEEKDGYVALQLGLGARREKVVKRPILGHIKKAGLKTIPRFLREVRLEEKTDLKPGEEVKIEDVLQPGDLVNVTGTSKGKGFAGVVKRWGFAGGPHTHGQSDRERAPGSIGATTSPGRVLKGKRMAGRMGQEQVTMRHLSVVATDPELNLIWVRGLVPGVKGGLVLVRKVGQAKKFFPLQTLGQEEKNKEVSAE